MAAAAIGDNRSVELLIKHGAKINAIDRFGTPLYYAVLGHHSNTVDLLLRCGAAVDLDGAYDSLFVTARKTRDRRIISSITHGTNR